MHGVIRKSKSSVGTISAEVEMMQLWFAKFICICMIRVIVHWFDASKCSRLYHQNIPCYTNIESRKQINSIHVGSVAYRLVSKAAFQGKARSRNIAAAASKT